MDKNLFAITANDTKTVKVRFQQMDKNTGDFGFYSKEYTYVTTMNLDLLEKVVVYVGSDPTATLKVAQVHSIDAGVDILPNDETEYKFIVSRVNTEDYDYVMQQKSEVERELAKAYQLNLKKQFAQQFLGGASQSLLEKLGYEVEDSK